MNAAIGIELKRMHAARKTPKHELPRGLSLEEMREHILAVANTPCHLGEHCRCKPDDRVGCWNEKA